MNAAKLKQSGRLKAVDSFLSDRKPHSTRDIIRATGMCAINSIISELRANGRKINCRRHENKWLYQRAR